MPYLFNVFHNFLYADSTDTPQVEIPNLPTCDCFCLAVVEGTIAQEGFKVKSNISYPVYNSEFIQLETRYSRPKELLSAALDIDPSSIISFFLKKKDQEHTRCYLMLQSKLDQYSKEQKAFYFHDKTLWEASQKIMNTIDRNLFGLQTRKQAEFYIQRVELAITNYSTKIKSEFADDPEKINVFSNDLHQDLAKLYFRYLEMIQSHLEITYAVYRDQSKQVTGKTLAIFATDLMQREASLKMHLQNNHINDTLSKIILSPLRLISDQGECREATPQRLNYLIRYAEELDKFFKTIDHVKEQQLVEYLYVLNYNSIAILHYIGDGYRRMKEEMGDDRSLLACLQERFMNLNHLPPSVIEPFNPDLLDLKKQVRIWLKEEIAHLKKTIKQKEKEQADQTTKLKFNYSVEVISAFFKLLHDAGITGSGANHTIRWINQNISSKNQPHISQQSIQRKFFDKYINKEPLKKIITHLLNHLNLE